MPAIWEEVADVFPVRENLVYLNHAGVSPLCRPAADAMKQLADECCEWGSFHYDRWLATYKALRSSAAQLIGAASREIAIVKNTSEGIATIANGITWKPGDRIVAFQEEFPSNWFPWKRLEMKGVEVSWLPATSPLDAIERATRGARLLAISFVQYLSGYRADLEAIGEVCERNGVLFLVDAIQGLGVFPLDVRRARIHALAADGHKWLMGPEGCALLFVRDDIQNQVSPTEWGWMNVANNSDFDSRDLKLRADAGRYECGSLNTIGCYGLRAALDFVQKIGVARIGAAVQSLADRLHAGVCNLGYEVLGLRTSSNGAGIVSFRVPGEDARLTIRKLESAGFVAALRGSWVRVSPHFYIPPPDIDRLLDALRPS